MARPPGLPTAQQLGMGHKRVAGGGGGGATSGKNSTEHKVTGRRCTRKMEMLLLLGGAGGGGDDSLSQIRMHLESARTALQNNDTQGAMLYLGISR